MEIYIGFLGFVLFGIGMAVLAYNLPETDQQIITNEDWHSAYQKSDH